MKKAELVEFIKSECKKHNVVCDLRNTTYVRIDTHACMGAFYPEGRLVVAMKDKMAHEVLLHEYCHMTQWLDNTEEWQNHQKIDPIEFNDWLDGGSSKNIETYIKWIIDLELDNEKRAVKLIEKLKLDFIDKKMYIKKSNLYLQYYNWLLIHKTWNSSKKRIYSSKKLLSMVPSSFRMNYYKISKKLENGFTEFFSKK